MEGPWLWVLARYLDQVQPDADFIPTASRALYTLPRPMFSALAMSVTERPALKSFTASSVFSRAEPMRERALAEARRLKLAQWYTPNRALTLALLRSARGDLKKTEKAKSLIAAAMREEMRVAKDERDLARAAAIADDYFRGGLFA